MRRGGNSCGDPVRGGASVLCGEGKGIITLDLGTSAFKCALVDASCEIGGDPIVESYVVRKVADTVTFPAEEYVRMARKLIRSACSLAARERVAVEAIGISSQAQTFITVGEDGKALADAVVWLDLRASAEAAGMCDEFSCFSAHSGLARPTGHMFMPKIAHLAFHQPELFAKTWKFMLLNEYVVYALTGEAYGDSCNQGMGGFYDVTERRLSGKALHLAGIGSEKLAAVFPAGTHAAPLASEVSAALGFVKPPLVFSCGNDQSCSAIGAGVAEEGDVLCNFGTAMVVYASRDDLTGRLAPNQMAGIHPLTDRCFLLGVESECGNVIEKAFEGAGAEGDFEAAMRRAVAVAEGGRGVNTTVSGDATGVMVERLGGVFGELVEGVLGGAAPRRLIAAGGLSRSDAWLKYLERRHGARFVKAESEHAGLVGIAKVILGKQNRRT